MINAAITPGTHPHRVRMSTIKKDPQPLSTTDSGGKKIASSTRNKFMMYFSTKTSKSHCYVSPIRQIKE
jgi:hypothetical protein